MKILFFVSTFPCTSETFVLNQVTSMIDKGHDVRIYSWGKGDKACAHIDIEKYKLLNKTWYMDMGIPCSYVKRFFKILPHIIKMIFRYGLSVLRLSNSRYGHPHHSKNLLQYYVANRFMKENWVPNVVISHFGDTGIIATSLRNAAIIPESTKCYTFFHAHEICRMTVNELAKFYRPMFNPQDILLPISYYWKKKIIAAGALPDNINVIRMGVDVQRFDFIDKYVVDNTIRILSVGRLCGQKGFEYAIRGVVEYAKNTQKQINYIIIGQGGLESKLKNIVSELCAYNYIHFVGAQPQQIVAEEMKKAHVFLLPSVTDDEGYMEGIPVALMEAMARGLICISTYHSGIPELIEDRHTGFLCEEKKSEEISDALQEIEQLSEAQITKMRNAARKKIEEDYNVITETKKLLNLIEGTDIDS